MEVKELVGNDNIDFEVTIYGKDEAEENRVSLELSYLEKRKLYDLTIYKYSHNDCEGHFDFEIENIDRAVELFNTLVELYKEELQ